MPSKRTSTRRQFLKGKSAADAVADLADRTFPREDRSQPATDRYLLRLARRAMACPFEVLLVARQRDPATSAAVAALDLIDELEAQLTVYRDTSEVARVNRSAYREPVVVEAGLFELLTTAVRLWRETGGAFDVTSGPLSKVWGFFQRQAALPAEQDLADALERTGSDKLLLDAEACSVQFARDGMEINLGGIGKGYALDRAAELLFEQGVDSFLIHGGQSSVVARGARGGEAAGDGWTIDVADPLRPEHSLAEIRLIDQALGTAGTSRQYFRYQGRRFGHIIDPRTGWPADKLVSVTVVAPTGAEADALATAFYSMGPDAAIEYCSRHPQVAALLVCPVGERNRIELRHTGLADGQLKINDS